VQNNLNKGGCAVHSFIPREPEKQHQFENKKNKD